MAKGNIKFSIEGIAQAKKILDMLPKVANDKIIYDINRAGANIVKKELQANAPDGDNDSKSSDKIQANIVVQKNREHRNAVSIGFAKKVFYVRFIEFGTKIRETLGRGRYKKGANRGAVQAKPFIKQSHETAAPKVIDFFQTNFLKLVNKSLKRQIKRLKKRK